ncbi:MAG: response regulator, partial [Anaerolineae bacterium]|nr:response regulator [Anaerolineae bacterium]
MTMMTDMEDAAFVQDYELLVIDDDLIQRTIIGKIGQQAGFRVVMAGTFEDAADLLKSRRFDSLTLDLSLGEKSGALLLPIIAHLGYRLPVIVISGVEDHVLRATTEMSRILSIETLPFSKPLNLVKLREALLKQRDNAP